VIQIYFTEKKRHFNSLEIQIANLMARRLSFVIARKKILSMHWNNEKKETIVRHIFHTLGSRGGVKLKDVYNRVIPEIADMVSLQSSALFSVASDLETVVLEAGYPEEGGYHSIGKRFPLKSEPSFELLLNLRHYAGDSVSEIVTPSYVLVVDPENSAWISAHMKQFASRYNINSILYIPLEVDGEVRHIITFDTLDQRQRYSDDEIDILLFVGRELMKAQRMERLDDALHDFKNPAIATAGFARRLKALLEREDRENSEEQIWKYVDILLQETSRLQELALSLYEVGKEQVLNLTEILQKRFDINKEAIREQLKQNVDLEEGPFDADLQILGYRLHLERIFDNLLNNATNAIPLKGGRLGIRTYADGEWACAEITNSGHISEEDRLKILEGEGEGRGLYITHRIIGMLKGKIEVEGGKETTTFIVRLPRHQPADGGSRQA
jgi:signal transduction histidine kinase